ncbi:phage tail protein [Novispirillum itersonii]|uniref:phage tail protein n=1 Tax=Novispirillum itersonii TaxID=189 RepID=UPI00039DF89F|nr:phage tail protein [Novispirillum itersonii]
MERIRHPNRVTTMPELDYTPVSPGYFTGGNPYTGTPATTVTADFLNAVQEEIINVVQLTGQTPDPDNNAQMASAISALIDEAGFRLISTTKTGDYTALIDDKNKVFNFTTSSVLNLPAAAVAGNCFTVGVRNSSPGLLTVQPSGAETIDSAASFRVGTGQTLLIISNGSNWFTLGGSDSVPVGTEMLWPGKTAPAGYLIENGALVARSTYPQLWEFAQASGMIVSDTEWTGSVANRSKFSSGDGSTTFRLPDLITGNLFIRAQAGTEPDFGRRQDDAFQAFQLVNSVDPTLKLTNNGLEGLGSATVSAPGAGRVHVTNGAAVPFNPLIPGEYLGNGTPRTSNETRPRNAGRLPIIKAFSAATNSGLLDLTSLANEVSGKVPMSAFTGINQSLTTNGWQKLPGGLILQWVTGSAMTAAPSSGAVATLTLPITFPNALLGVSVTAKYVSGNGCSIAENASDTTNSAVGVFLANTTTASGTYIPRIIAIGY